MNKKLKIFLTIVGTALFVLTFLWLASFAFRLFMSGGSEGFLRSLITGKFTLNTQVRSYSHPPKASYCVALSRRQPRTVFDNAPCLKLSVDGYIHRILFFIKCTMAIPMKEN